MTVYRNNSDREVYDFLSRQSALPGGTITVPDFEDQAPYEDHPIWQAIPDLGGYSGGKTESGAGSGPTPEEIAQLAATAEAATKQTEQDQSADADAHTEEA